MKTFSIAMQSRAFGNILPLGVTYHVQRFSRSVMGGPKEAEIIATGADADLWELFERVRCPIVIYNAYGVAVWWGYVASIDARVGNISAGVDIDTMHNRIAVAYSRVTTGSTSGKRATTAWTQDDDSVAEYGTRELLSTTSGSTDAHAVAARDALLAQKRFPTPVISVETPSNDRAHEVTIRARGWWSTLEWIYYSNTSTSAVDTGTQITNILTSAGQFIRTIEGTTSSISTSPLRDGDSTANQVLDELMRMGTSNIKRLLSTVDATRKAFVYEEPAQTFSNTYILRSDGMLFYNTTPIDKTTCPVGLYIRLHNVIPSSVDTSRMTDAGLFFADETEYIVADDWLKFTARGAMNPFELGRPKDG